MKKDIIIPIEICKEIESITKAGWLAFKEKKLDILDKDLLKGREAFLFLPYVIDKAECSQLLKSQYTVKKENAGKYIDVFFMNDSYYFVFRSSNNKEISNALSRFSKEHPSLKRVIVYANINTGSVSFKEK